MTHNDVTAYHKRLTKLGIARHKDGNKLGLRARRKLAKLKGVEEAPAPTGAIMGKNCVLSYRG